MRQAPIRTGATAGWFGRRGRYRLLGGASALAAAVVLLVAPQQAAAQIASTGRAFEANPTANPDFSITRSDTQDVVRIFNSSTVINWRPVDTATSSAVIDILPTGNTLTFTGDANFTVLNRVIPDDPTRAIQFSGGVFSLVGGAPGGNVWFYSPGGIIAGPNSVFLVGGLVLTSSNMTAIGAGGTQMNFLGATAGSRVEVQPGAQLLASNYVVLWAPRVVQGGGVAAEGNISYVGAEQGTLTVTGGLFDMVIDVGTDDPNGVVHTGISTGGTPVDNPVRAITMATVAKNDFVNMLVGGAVGYADASVATAGNGVIVLSAANGAQPNSGNITIGPALFNSTTLASAAGDLTIALNGQNQALTIGSATNEADFFGLAGRNLTINATSGATVNAADNFFAQAAAPGQGGVLTVNINDAGRDNDSSISGLLVGGNLTLSAFGNGVDNIPVNPLAIAASPTFGGNGVGGTIGISVSQGGELFVGGTTQFSAAGTAGIGGLFSGNATGGTINLTLNGTNSRVQFGGNALFDVSANRSAPGPVNAGGSVTAGSINLALNAGSFTFTDLTLTANADADDSINATGRFNGAAGGTINLTNTARLTGASLTANALGIGGDGGTSATASDAGGDGNGGSVSLTNGVGGSLTLQAVNVTVTGSGGEGGRGDVLINGARGGSGFGGDITIANAGTLAGTPTLTLSAAGTGGNGGTGGASLDDFNPGAEGGAAGSGFGGSIDLTANGAATAVQINSLIDAAGTGGTGGTGGEARSFESGNGGAGGTGQGGDIALVSTAGGSLQITAGTGTLTLDSGGAGGAGGDEGFGLNPVGNPGQNGASGGGTVDLLATGGALTVTGNLVADASAVGNQDLRPGATGADATGGTITTNVSGGGALTTSGGLWLNASALAAIGNLSAGTGRGGTVAMLMSGAGSSFNVQGQFPLVFANPPRGRALYVDTSAYEPQSGNPLLQTASGGDTFGGAINLAFTGGNSTIAGRTELRNFSAALNPLSGVGPGPQVFLDNATATGGTIDIALSNGTHTWGSLDGSVTTFGFGGSAINGTVRATLDNATLNLIATPGGNGALSLITYVAGEISQSDPEAVVLRVLNGSTLTANGGISLFADSGHGISTNTITTGNVVLEVDASTVSVATNSIFLGNEAQAFRFPGVATNTSGADALAGNVSFSATNGSTISGDVQIRSFALADAGPDGGDARSGDLSYVLDGSTHTGALAMLSFAEGQGASAGGGTGGTTTGGNQTIAIRNGADFTGDVDLETTLYTYHAGGAGGPYGNLFGGTASIIVTDSTANIGVLGNLFDGAADPAPFFEAGTNITAGAFALELTNSTVTIGDASIILDATGGAGGAFAAGGTGQAGSILVTSDALSSLTINDALFSANGFGGQGGDAISSGDGEAGGTGIGGSIGLFSLGDLDLNSMLGTARGQGGSGGSGALGGAGGNGGFGQGGTAAFEVSTAPGLAVTLGSLSLDSSAIGGAGGRGDDGFGLLTGGTGGAGGSAGGGTSRFRVTGAGASLAFDPFLFNLSSSALGGTGGAGGNNLSGGTAGAGGNGGEASGGTIALEAGSGAELTLLQVSAGPFQFSVGGTGGAGGSGGSIDMISGGTAGAGGDGGNGTGGSPTLRAVGGRIVVGEIDIRATGIGGSGGIGGTDGTVTLGADGNGGNGFGGSPLLETLDGSPGRLTLGTVTIDASGFGGSGTQTGLTAGGQITITDGSADPAGLITMGSLTVTASGPLTPPGTPSLTIEGSSGPITVTGDVSATVAGDINFLFDGTGRLVVGGATTLDAGGSISLSHTNNSGGIVSLDSAGNILARADNAITGAVGSALSGSEVFLLAGRDINLADVRAVPALVLTAGGSVTLGNASVTGPQGLSNLSGIVIDAGLDPFGSSVYDNLGNARISGTVSSYAGIAINAGGRVEFAAGSQTLAGNNIIVRTGDDIIIGTGARLQSARDPALVLSPTAPFGPSGAIDLHAGGLTPLLSIPSTPIASLVVDGTINAGRGAVIARANAIDGIDGAFSGSSLSFDIDNAPPVGAVLSDDNGLLSAPCLEGNVCLGSISASNLLLVGQASPDDVLALTIEQGTVNAREIRIATRNDIVMGTSGIATTLNATDLFSASSRAGNVDLRDATIASDLIRIEAAGSLLGSASLTSTGDIGVSVGDSLFASAITTGGELTTVADAGGALEGSFSVPGTLAVGSLSLGAGAVDYAAGTIDIGQLAAPGTDVRLIASGALSLGQTTGVANLDLQGGTVSGGDLSATGDIAILSGSNIDLLGANAGGSVALDLAGNLSFASLQAAGDITANAAGTANGGDLDAQGTVTLDAARIAIGSASGNALSLSSATDVLFDALSSPSSISIIAADGTIAGNTTAGLIDTDGDLTLRARAINLRDLAAGGAIDIAVTGTALTLGRLDAGTDIVLGSAGSIAVDHAEAAGDFTATAALGFATGPNSIVTGGDIVINAGGPAVLGNSIAGGLIEVNASQIDFASLVAGTTIELTTVPAFATAGGTGNITGGSLQAGAGNSSLVTTAGNIALTGNAVVGGDLVVTANGGSIAMAGVGTVGGSIALVASSDVSFGALSAGGSSFAVSSGRNIAFEAASSGGSISMTAAGTLTGGDLTAGAAVDLTAAGGISLSSLTGSAARLAAAGGEVRVSVQIDVPGLVEASGQSVFLRSTRNLAVQAIATAGDIDVLTSRDLDVRGAEATGGDIRLTSVNGVASVAGINAAASASGTATGGNVTIEAGENLDVTGAITAANAIDLRAGERASIGAAVVGREISLRASDVAISSTGSLGTLASTRTIAISGGGIARIGGSDGSTPGFVIDNAEFARIRASGAITISASTAIILDTLDIRVANGTTADGNLRGEGRIDFAAAEGIDIVGEVIMAGATADSAIGLTTSGDVFLDARTGLLEINDGAGNYLGLIDIEALNFHAMTPQARTDVRAATSIGAIDSRLAQNDGIDNPDGLIRTGTLDITTIASDVFIQNTAAGRTFAARRGFTVDALLIADRGGTNQPIVINGIIAGATGVDAVTLAQISSTFDPGSTINGCLIANPAGCIQLPEVVRGVTFPVQDLIEQQLDEEAAEEGGVGAGVLDAPLIELRDPIDTSEDPLLDDPVTGAGNEDLWVSDQPGG